MTSLRSRILHQVLYLFSGAVSSNLSIEKERAQLETLTHLGIRSPKGVDVQAIQAEGIQSEWIEPTGKNADRVILYIHGGGYCTCSLNTHRGLAARLAIASEARLLIINYRLAPENPFPAALEDALAAYHWLLSQGISSQQIAIGGDSAGGGLTLATTVSLRDAGQELPAALFLLSPWTDLTSSGNSYHTRKKVDPVFGRKGIPKFGPAYVGKQDPTNPLISPLFADLQHLPPALIHVGSDEILLDDSTRLDNNLKAAGVESSLEIWDGMWHVFQVYAPHLSEAQQSIDKLGDFIRQTIR